MQQTDPYMRLVLTVIAVSLAVMAFRGTEVKVVPANGEVWLWKEIRR